MLQTSTTNPTLIKTIEGAPSLFAELSHLGDCQNHVKGTAEPFFVISIPVFKQTPITRQDGWQDVKPTEEFFDVKRLQDAARKFAGTVKLKLQKEGYEIPPGISYVRGSVDESNPPSIADNSTTFLNSGKTNAQVFEDVQIAITETEREMKHILETASRPAIVVFGQKP